MKTNEISLAIIFSSLYAVLVLVLAPISYGPIQLRVADCMIPLAALFGWPVIAGVTVGCFLGNAYFWLGPQDVILVRSAGGPLVLLQGRKQRAELRFFSLEQHLAAVPCR